MDAIRDDELLQRFAEWLQAARGEALARPTNGAPATPESEDRGDVGLFRLVEEFTALRHELKLQTKSARGLEEQTQSLLAALRDAAETMRSVQPKEAQAAWSAARPLALALAEIDEALDRGRNETERAVAALLDDPVVNLVEQLEELYRQQSWLARAGSRRYHEAVRALVERELAEHPRRPHLESLLDGYRLIQSRLAQLLAAEGISRIPAEGHPVDPEQMVVVEVVERADLPSGIVVDEIRRGYLWQGRLLRYAEVRASRNGTADEAR